ncbi:hypothetical protein CWC31_09955 [Pseudoalteromonas ruthenica]|nr:hypothetical protein CWC31_09955 [Pseudoalteromonas ruthenica]
MYKSYSFDNLYKPGINNETPSESSNTNATLNTSKVMKSLSALSKASIKRTEIADMYFLL